MRTSSSTTESSVQLLMDILSIPTVNGKDREADLAEFLKDFFISAGIDAYTQKIDEKRSNIIAHVEGQDSLKKVVWNGHIDTVPYGDTDLWNTDPATPVISEGKVFGRGASDMKSGLAAMVYTLCSMKERGIVPSRTIQFIGTCDEESGGAGASKVLEDDLLGSPEYILIGEPTNNNIGIAQKGCMWVKFHVRGAGSHAAYPEQGENAIIRGHEFYNRLAVKLTAHTHPLFSGSTASLTLIEGGTTMNVIPDTCSLVVDIRFIPSLASGEVFRIIDETVLEIERESGGRSSIEYEVLNSRRSLEVPANNPKVELLCNEITRCGRSPELFGINYFTDASVLTEEGSDIPVFLFGPGNQELCHKPNESVDLKQYKLALSVLERLYCSGTVR